MGSMQRADRFEQLFKALKKHYKPISPVVDRKVLDHILYACCLQDASYEAADEAFAKLQQTYFDSNEIRVTTIAELAESLNSLPHGSAAAARIKKTLQSMFEGRYSFDIDDLKKSNLGKAVDEIAAWQGVTKFMVAYVTQHAFGGHSIPVDDSTLTVCQLLELLTPAETEKGILPGIERAIAKNRGLEFASLIHQFAVDHAHSFKNPLVVAVFKELGMTSKPKAPPPPPPAPPKASKTAASKPADVKPEPKNSKSKAATPPTKTTSQVAKPIVSISPTSKPKKSEPAPMKSAEMKTSKEVAPAKPSKSSKMVTPPPSTKTALGSAKAAQSTSKKSIEATKDKKTAKEQVKRDPKSTAKPAVKKAESKKIETKKPVTKKGAASKPAKPTTKGSSATVKPSPKKLPVKPVTKKRTKPR